MGGIDGTSLLVDLRAIVAIAIFITSGLMVQFLICHREAPYAR
jgi:hypothetical protein